MAGFDIDENKGQSIAQPMHVLIVQKSNKMINSLYQNLTKLQVKLTIHKFMPIITAKRAQQLNQHPAENNGY